MILLELKNKIHKGDIVEIFTVANGRKQFTGYVTEIYENAFVLMAEGMVGGKEGNEFIQTKSLSATFTDTSLIANWYQKHL